MWLKELHSNRLSPTIVQVTKCVGEGVRGGGKGNGGNREGEEGRRKDRREEEKGGKGNGGNIEGEEGRRKDRREEEKGGERGNREGTWKEAGWG